MRLAWRRGREQQSAGCQVVLHGRTTASCFLPANLSAFWRYTPRSVRLRARPQSRRPPAGFARNLDWEVMATSPSPVPSVSLRLVDSDATRTMWPHHFEAIYTVTLANDRYAPSCEPCPLQSRWRLVAMTVGRTGAVLLLRSLRADAFQLSPA